MAYVRLGTRKILRTMRHAACGTESVKGQHQQQLSFVDALEASHGPGGGLGHLRSRPRPVGRPRRPVPSRPTAASRRRPRLQLRRRARAAAEAADRQGEFSPGRSVSLSSERAREGGRVVDLQSWSVSSRVVCARWGSGVQGTSEEGIGRPGLVRVSSSVMDAVRACLLTRFLRRVAPRFSCPGLFVGLALARARCAIAGGSAWLLAVTSRACHLGSQCAVRLFRWMGVWGVLVGLIKFSGFLFGLRPVHRPRPPAPSTGPVHRPRPTPPPAAPPRRRPRRRHDPT